MILTEEQVDMERRVSRLEGGYEHLATKADLERAINTLTWRFIGFGVVLAGAVTGILGLLIRLWA